MLMRQIHTYRYRCPHCNTIGSVGSTRTLGKGYSEIYVSCRVCGCAWKLGVEVLRIIHQPFTDEQGDFIVAGDLAPERDQAPTLAPQTEQSPPAPSR